MPELKAAVEGGTCYWNLSCLSSATTVFSLPTFPPSAPIKVGWTRAAPAAQHSVLASRFQFSCPSRRLRTRRPLCSILRPPRHVLAHEGLRTLLRGAGIRNSARWKKKVPITALVLKVVNPSLFYSTPKDDANCRFSLQESEMHAQTLCRYQGENLHSEQVN